MTLNSATWYINLAQVVRVAHKIVIRLLHSVTSKPINTCTLRICYTIHTRIYIMYIVDSYRFVYGAHLSSNRKRYHKMLPCNKHRNGFSEQIEKHRGREEEKRDSTGGKAYFFFLQTQQTTGCCQPLLHCLWVLFRHFVLVCVSAKFFRICVGVSWVVYAVCFTKHRNHVCEMRTCDSFIHAQQSQVP